MAADEIGSVRRVEVAPARLAGWVESFGERHGGALPGQAETDSVTFRAADGAQASCQVPFPPLAASPGTDLASTDLASTDLASTDLASTDPAILARQLADHAMADRMVGVLLVRLGGYAAGVFTGGELTASKVGSRLVHGRSAAGGQSQQRFARRRENQAHQALGAAADTAAAVFAPYALDAVVLGGDRRAMAGLRADVRLAPYFALAVETFLTVPDPRLAVLRSTPAMFRAIKVTLTEPAQPAGTA